MLCNGSKCRLYQLVDFCTQILFSENCLKEVQSTLLFLILFIQFQWTDWFSCTIIQLNGREELRICIVFGKCKNYFYCKHILHQSFIDILQFPYLGGGLPLTFQGFIDYDMTIQNSDWMFPCICYRYFAFRSTYIVLG